METLYQGAKDVFLAGVRADFDSIEDQALKSSRALKDYSLMGTDSQGDTLYTMISDTVDEGERVVWRHIGTTGVKELGTRSAGNDFPQADFIRTYETAVYDPDNQVAGEFKLPDERNAKEGRTYKQALNRASKLLYEIDRMNVRDPFEVFNIAFTAPSSYPTTGTGGGRFFARGNEGLDGNKTALGERLVSIQHARADGGATQSNAVQDAGNAAIFSDTTYWAAREQGATFLDDVGKETPRMGARVDVIVAPANNLVRTAKEMNESDWVVNSTDNQINIHRGTMSNIITSPFLLKSAYVSGVANTAQWFLIDGTERDPQTGTGLVSVSFVPLASKVYRNEAKDYVAYTIKEERTYGFVDWRNILGSKGDGAPYSS